MLSLVKRAWIANSVFFKTLSISIYTSNMIKDGGQGGLKRKSTDPKYLWVRTPSMKIKLDNDLAVEFLNLWITICSPEEM